MKRPVMTSSNRSGGRWLKRSDLAEEIVLGGGRQAGVGVGRADHAELERIGAESFLVLQAALERRAGVLARQHVRRVQS